MNVATTAQGNEAPSTMSYDAAMKKIGVMLEQKLSVARIHKQLCEDGYKAPKTGMTPSLSSTQAMVNKCQGKVYPSQRKTGQRGVANISKVELAPTKDGLLLRGVQELFELSGISVETKLALVEVLVRKSKEDAL